MKTLAFTPTKMFSFARAGVVITSSSIFLCYGGFWVFRGDICEFKLQNRPQRRVYKDDKKKFSDLNSRPNDTLLLKKTLSDPPTSPISIRGATFRNSKKFVDFALSGRPAAIALNLNERTVETVLLALSEGLGVPYISWYIRAKQLFWPWTRLSDQDATLLLDKILQVVSLALANIHERDQGYHPPAIHISALPHFENTSTNLVNNMNSRQISTGSGDFPDESATVNALVLTLIKWIDQMNTDQQLAHFVFSTPEVESYYRAVPNPDHWLIYYLDDDIGVEEATEVLVHAVDDRTRSFTAPTCEAPMRRVKEGEVVAARAIADIISKNERMLSLIVDTAKSIAALENSTVRQSKEKLDADPNNQLEMKRGRNTLKTADLSSPGKRVDVNASGRHS